MNGAKWACRETDQRCSIDQSQDLESVLNNAWRICASFMIQRRPRSRAGRTLATIRTPLAKTCIRSLFRERGQIWML